MKKNYLVLVALAAMFNFATSQAQCTGITAPYVENFDVAAGSIPNCWSQGASNSEDWKFNDGTLSDHVGDFGDHLGTASSSGGYYAYVDDSTPDNMGTTLETPEVNVSGLVIPALSFYMISDNEGQSNVSFSVDFYDGANWNVGVFTSSSNTGGWTEVFINLSSYTITGPVKARFIVDEDNPSGQFYDDVAIDDVRFDELPSCTKPNASSLAVANIVSSGADIIWSAGPSGETEWDLVYGTSGFDPNTGGVTVVDNDGVSGEVLSGLSPQTMYDVYVRAICGPGDKSAFIGPLSFATACTSYTLPFTEDFDTAAGSIPLCWEMTGGENWLFDNVAPTSGHIGDNGNITGTTPSGGYFAWIDDSGTSAPSTLTSPLIDISTASNPTLYFYEISDNEGNANATLDVEVFDGSGWNSLISLTGNTNGWQETIVSLNPYQSAGNIRVRFTITGSSSFYDDIAIDDISIKSGPACIDPNNIEVVNTTADGAEVAWTNFSGSTMWNVEYGLSGFAQGTGTVLNISSNPYTFTGLALGTEYDFYLQADCGNGDLSTWIGPVSFETLKIGSTCELPIDVTSLPYSFTGTTADYQDNYAGAVGTGCGSSEDYLNGFETFYEYTAANDDLIDILLSDLSGFYAGVFVYDSCGDVASTCAAGAVAGPSDADFGIEDFPVVAGEDYYIVISSWLNPTVGYTLDIIPFDCSLLATPDADANQDFAAGDTLADLEVDATETPSTFTWYSDAAGTTVIPDTTVLVDGTTYYVTQTFNGCESAPIAITVSEIDCSSLDIVSTTGDSATCKGSMILSATASGTGDDIYWYSSSTGGDILGTGSQFTTPELTTTTSYWASEVYLIGPGNSSGIGMQTYAYGFGSTLFTTPKGLAFNATESFTIVDVEVFSTSTGGTMDVKLLDDTGAELASTNVSIPAGTTASPTAVTLPLNFIVPGAGDYQLVSEKTSGTISMMYEYDFSGLGYPMSIGNSGEIVEGVSGNFTYDYYYYYFYNWTIFEGELVCESPREEAVATVNQTGDQIVDFTDLPYTTTDSTVLYGNNFSGNPGGSCPGSDILNGNDVVYQYTADPVNDDVLQIELSGISGANTGMFIYTSCGDVGGNCLDGVENEGSSMVSIDDYYVSAGDVIFIVISSASGSTNYTLNINGFDCANAPAPIVETSPYFVSPDTLGDIDIEENVNSTGITFYSDAAGTMVLPGNTPLVDGTTYYVAQTILGCESTLVAITPIEFDCAGLSVTGQDITICDPGGEVSLTAQAGGTGSEIYWYNAATGGDILNLGDTYDVDVTQTTSFWASEVFVKGEVPIPGLGIPTYDYGFGSSLFTTPKGLEFTATESFTIVDVEVFSTSTGGTMDVYLLDVNSGTTVISKNVTIPSGSTASPTPVKIPLNYVVPGAGTYRLLAQETSGNVIMMYEYDFSNGVGYPLSLGNSGEIVEGVSNTFTYDYYYYYFYNWTIGNGELICESPREEIVVTVNDQPTAAPSGDAVQKFCEGARVNDLVGTGSDIKWYADATAAFALSETDLLVDGETYYASQTVDACESDTRLEVVVSVKDNGALPIGATNQAFVVGETIADLVVQGDNLIWYEDRFKLKEITDLTQVLVDQETYYVSQSPNGFCESDVLSVTVHRLLNTEDPLFSGLNYYPNPMRDQLTVEHSMPIESITVYSLLGQQVLHQSVNLNKADLNISELASGPYFIRVSIDGRSTMFKVIKE